MHSQGEELVSGVLARSQPLLAQSAARWPWQRTSGESVGRADAVVPERTASRPAGNRTPTSWFALRVTLIDLLRRSFFVTDDPWAQRGAFELPHGGFVRWEWLEGVGSPVHVELNPGAGGPIGISTEHLIARLVTLGWNTPEHPWSFCWIEAPRPEMWLRSDQRQRFADAADRIILALTVVLDLAPADVMVPAHAE